MLNSLLAVEDARTLALAIVNTIHEPFLVLGADLRVVAASRSFYETFRVDPAETVPSPRSVCPSGPCRFALAGGGIDNWGVLTLKNTRVAGNRLGGALNSEAVGGGILEEETGQMTLENSVVAGNRSIASAPNGRFAEGGGIFVAGGTLTIRGGAVAHNLAALDSALPNDVGQLPDWTHQPHAATHTPSTSR